MHIDRLRNIKGSLDVKKPNKPTFMLHNLKRELQTLGKIG